MDYQKEYNEYWSRPDRWGSHSFRDPDLIADQIAAVCGSGKILDAGFGMGLLVKTLLQRGMDAHGMDIAERVVQEANQFAPGHFKTGSLLAMPYGDEAFETIVSTDCLEHIAEPDVPQALAEFHRVAQRFLFVQLATTPDRDKRWHLTIRDRAWWEQQFFNAGFRKHPATQKILPYESLNNESWQITLVFEKIPASALAKYPLSALKAERDLHMDMLRESGRRSDAHIARYMLARQFLPKAGLVLDAACGLGYGGAILAHDEPAVRVLGIDSSAYAVDYARTNFAGTFANIEFRQGDVNDLADIADESVSLVASFETIEHLREPELFLAEVQRVLKPRGVFLSSVPNLWVDDTGKDPNPHHFHVFDFPKLAALCRKFFTLREIYRQTAGGGMKLPDAPRELRRVQLPVTAEAERAEWWLVAGVKEKTITVPRLDVSAPERELIVVTSDPTHPMYTSWLSSWDGPWKAVPPASADLNLLREAALVVTHDIYIDPGRKLVREAFAAGVPTLILADGILEYRNTWEHPQLEPGAIFQPVPGHKIACLGRSQARILESWGNCGKCEITGSPRLDHYCELQRRQKPADEPFRILVMTALTPWFTEGQRHAVRTALRDVKEFFAGQQSIGGFGMQPVWRLTQGLDEEFGLATPVAQMDFSGRELSEILRQVDAVITTPSTAMLEAMLLGLPVATLDYTNSPAYAEAAWRITARTHLPAVIGELMRPPEPKMLFQETTLHDALECATPATSRLAQLIREMMNCVLEARQSGRPFTFPERILQSETNWHSLRENRFHPEKLYPAQKTEPSPQEQIASTNHRRSRFNCFFNNDKEVIPKKPTHTNGSPAPKLGTQNPEPGTLPKILFISHDASRSGAPMQLLNVMRAARNEWEPRILLRAGGPLETEFQQLGETTICATPGIQPEVWKDVSLIYSNTCTNGAFLRAFPPEGPPVITHIHELPFAIGCFGDENFELVKKHTTHFIACSEAVSQSLQKQHAIPAEKISMIHGGVSVATIRERALERSIAEARQWCGMGAQDFVIGACGFADWRKGPDLFLQLADTLRRRNGHARPLSFLWIGRIPADSAGRLLLHDLQRLGLGDTVKFIGEQANPHPFLNACDVFCSCSREDPFPLVMLEAAALGKPIVCFENSGGAPEFCARGAGFTTPYLNLEAMGQVLLQFADDDKLRERVGDTGRALVEQEFDTRHLIPRIVQLIEKFHRPPEPKSQPPPPPLTFAGRLKKWAAAL